MLTAQKEPILIAKSSAEEGVRFRQSLCELYYGKMMGVCLRYAKDKDQAKDILHDGFIKVFDKINQFDNKGSLEGWIRRVMVNTAIDFCRKNTFTFSMDEKFDLEDLDSNGTNESDLEAFLNTFSADQIMKMVQGLSPVYRVVFNLYAIENYSHKEISEKLGISEGASKSNLSRARINLQKMFFKSKVNSI